jgi:hypothetical protein
VTHRKTPKRVCWPGVISQCVFMKVPVCASQPVFILDISVDFKMLAAVFGFGSPASCMMGTSYVFKHDLVTQKRHFASFCISVPTG